MAGYDHNVWKSNNAVVAEQHGLLTAGRAAAVLGVSRVTLEAVVWPHERHHVGGGYAFVGYYDLAQITADQRERMRSRDREFRPYSLRSATVRWLDWPRMAVSRFARGRKPQPTEREAVGCRVTFATPATLRILLPDGSTMTKRTTTKGLEVIDDAA